MIVLTIGIISLPNRLHFLSKLLEVLQPQLTDNVELLILTDNRKRTVGHKRNDLNLLAQGQQIVQIDDDDMISNDFVQSILEACQRQTDCVVQTVGVSLNGSSLKPCQQSIKNEQENRPEAQYRKVNPRMVIQTKLAKQVPLLNVNFGEDDEWAHRLQPLLHTETVIDKILYFYHYNAKTSETAQN